MSNVVALPLQYYPDPSIGRPVFNGKIYIGEPDTDPEILANRKSVTLKQEDGSLVVIAPEAQPLLTSSGGLVTYNGGYPQVLVDSGQYALKILNKNDVQVMYIADVAPLYDPVNEIKTYTSVASLRDSTGNDAFNVIEIESYYAITYPSTAGPKGGHKRHRTGGTNTSPTVGSPVAVSTIGTGTQAGYVWDGDGVEWYISCEDVPNVYMLGAVGDGVADDYQSFIDAIEVAGSYNAGATLRGGRRLNVLGGTFYLSQNIQLKKTIHMDGEGGAVAGNNATRLRFAADVIGITLHRYNTIDSGVESPTTFGADGSIISNMDILSDGETDTTAHGIWMRARGFVFNVGVSGFAANGVHIYSTSGSGTPSQEGNANNWALQNMRIINCLNGIYVDGADANAGYAMGVDCSGNSAWGIYDGSFLGNSYYGCHTNGNGELSQISDGVNRYYVAEGEGAEGTNAASSTTPGTDPAVWVLIGAGGVSTDYPLWVNGNPYWTGGGMKGEDANARSVFSGCYNEPGQPPSIVNSPSVVLGGSFGSNIGSALEMRDSEIRNSTDLQSTYMHLKRSYSNDYLLQLWNDASFSSSGSRAVRMQFKLGDEDATNELLGAISAKAGASSSGTTRHDLRLEVYDGAAAGFETAVLVDGSSRDVEPGADNLWNCGSASFRWKEVYAATATINTSDERLKTFLTVDAAEQAAALEIKANLRKFKFNDAIEKKGDSARIHFGVSAQQAGQIMTDHGLNPDDYAFYCYDEWEEEVEDGEIVQESGNRYGIRYEELLSFILAAL